MKLPDGLTSFSPAFFQGTGTEQTACKQPSERPPFTVISEQKSFLVLARIQNWADAFLWPHTIFRGSYGDM